MLMVVQRRQFVILIFPLPDVHDNADIRFSRPLSFGIQRQLPRRKKLRTSILEGGTLSNSSNFKIMC